MRNGLAHGAQARYLGVAFHPGEENGAPSSDFRTDQHGPTRDLSTDTEWQPVRSQILKRISVSVIQECFPDSTTPKVLAVRPVRCNSSYQNNPPFAAFSSFWNQLIQNIKQKLWRCISRKIDCQENALPSLGKAPVLGIQTTPSQRKGTFRLYCSSIKPRIRKAARH